MFQNEKTKTKFDWRASYAFKYSPIQTRAQAMLLNSFKSKNF